MKQGSQIVLAASIAVGLSTSASAQTEARYFQIATPISLGVYRFAQGITIPTSTDQPTTKPIGHLSLLIVYGAGAPRADGAAYFTLEQSIDCATQGVLETAYETHSADGRTIERSAAAPAEALALASGPGFDGLWRTSCQIATGRLPSPAPPPPPRPGVPAQKPFYGTAAEALSLARQRDAEIAAARSLPQTGRYRLISVNSRGAMLINLDDLKRGENPIRVSLLFVNPSASRGYGRLSYLVNCVAQTAALDYSDDFSADGQLAAMSGTLPATPLPSIGALGQLLGQACVMQRPGLFEKTYPTVTAALQASRAQMGLE